jgi:hypothetical protein
MSGIKRAVVCALMALFLVVVVARNVSSHPAGNSMHARPANRDFTVQGGAIVPSANKVHRVLWVDGTTYATLSACYSALEESGGTCMVPPGYSETLAKPLTLSKKYTGFVFTGPATINMQANSIIVPAGTHGVFIDSWVPFGSVLSGTGVVFQYTGSSSAISVGSDSVDTMSLRLRNLMVDLNGNRHSSVVGVNIVRTQRCDLQNLYVSGDGTKGQTGLVLDGRGTYTACLVQNPIILSAQTGIKLSGSGSNSANGNQIVGGSINGSTKTEKIEKSIGIDFEGGSQGNVVLGTDIEGTVAAVNFGGVTTGNYVVFRSEANTTDVSAAAGSSSNMVQLINSPINPVVVDKGSSNSVQSGVQRLAFLPANTFLNAAGGGALFLNLGGGTSGVRFGNGAGKTMASIDGKGNGSFKGDLAIDGIESFRIDHPLDSSSKYLQHAAVESPEMKNIYDGIATLGADGSAVVKLPRYFEALNKDFRYQLTCVGGAAPVYVAHEVHNNEFVIAGGRPGLKVSWQITGIRHDAYANSHPMAVEVEKPQEDRR